MRRTHVPLHLKERTSDTEDDIGIPLVRQGAPQTRPDPSEVASLRHVRASSIASSASSTVTRRFGASTSGGQKTPNLFSSFPDSEDYEMSASGGGAHQPSTSAVVVVDDIRVGLNKDGSRVIPLHPSERGRARYPANVICNQKYSFLTFLPVALYEQFKYFFNLYFLLVALSQLVPELKVGYLFTYIGPLAFVLVVTLSKEAFDDIARRKRDRDANSQIYTVLAERGQTREVTSANIVVGDLVVVKKDQRVPADMVLLRSSDISGSCFIRTDQLDGETDWKLRNAVPSCQQVADDASLLMLGGYIYADRPMMDIHAFVGNFTNTATGNVEPLDVNNMLWADTVVAAGAVVGAVVYTGRETRTVLNTDHPLTKFGALDLQLNNLAKILCVVTLSLSFALVALNRFRGFWWIYLLRFLILFSSIIPISLRVNLDLGKMVHSHQIMHDDDIARTVVRTSTIPEELGRIEYVLSDKTGTLTQNEMELKKIHIGSMLFSNDSMDELAIALASSHGLNDRIYQIVLALALCHNVTPATSEEDGSVTYQASSPDEVAIVRWTESVGLRLLSRDANRLTLACRNGDLLHYNILETFPFSSELKRMGIVVQEMSVGKQPGQIVFYEKGADVAMTQIVRSNDWLDEECGNMAREGLRTLVIGRKLLSSKDYEAFQKSYAAAQATITDRAATSRLVVSSMLETNLELLGVTGVEDRLQEGVMSSLEMLRNAGIKVWILTGDKVETATCIAISSKLVSRNQPIITIEKISSPLELQDQLELLHGRGDACLVIDGQSLQLAMDHFLTEFLQVAKRLPAIADITKLLKAKTRKRICAIGDGGNDVSMIRAAHVGIGIVGKEGRQAALAADFSIEKFSHITKLLLWHGRNSYKRSAKLSQFVIHRGLIVAIMQAVFSSIFYFAPIALYQGMLVVGYSTVFTMAPVFSLVLDTDISQDIALLYPELYKELRKGRSLSYKTFFSWLLISVYQGGAIMTLAIFLFPGDFMNIVSISFTVLILNELLMVALEITTWHRYMVYAEVATLAIYLASMCVLDADFDSTFMLTWRFCWRVLVITAVSSLPLYIIKHVRRLVKPPSYAKLV